MDKNFHCTPRDLGTEVPPLIPTMCTCEPSLMPGC